MSIPFNDPEQNEYDDDEYKYYPDGGQFNEYNEHGFPKEFKFDWSAWELWLKQALDDIVEEGKTWTVGGFDNNEEEQKFPVSGALPNGALKDKYFMYLGSNHYDEAVWKAKYFIVNEIDQEYKKHIVQHAQHFLKQPSYYRGMFDILN